MLTTPFTPGVGAGSLVAATLFTPRVSGVIQVTATLAVINGATPDTYGLATTIFSGTGLTVSGGEALNNGWVLGSNTPPVVGGAGVAFDQLVGEAILALAASGQGTLSAAAAISQPLPVGVPVAVEVALIELGGGNPVATLAFVSLSVLELP